MTRLLVGSTLAALALAAGSAGASGASSPDGSGGFSFAVISDLHLGAETDDFGTPGYEDELGRIPENAEAVRNAKKAVATINVLKGREGLQFVFVVGDLTDSAERSEFALARILLDSLAVPYMPLMGNHDIWPYTKQTSAPTPNGDAYFQTAFADVFASLKPRFPDWVKADGPVWNPERGHFAHYQNFAFSFGGYGFICLDWSSRKPAPSSFPGSHAQADLHNFKGGTYPWFAGLVSSGWLDDKKQVFLFQHHPFRTLVPDWAFAFSRSEKQKIAARLRREEFWGVFAGHTHQNRIGLAFDRFTRIPRPFARGPEEGSAWDELIADAAPDSSEDLRDVVAGPPQEKPFYQIETAAALKWAAVTLVRVSSDGQISLSQH